MKRLALLLSLLGIVGLGVSFAAMAGGNSAKVLKFERMAPVVAPFTGATNPIRGLTGGGVPWSIDSGTGYLRADGRLHVEVQGLIIPSRATTRSRRSAAWSTVSRPTRRRTGSISSPIPSPPRRRATRPSTRPWPCRRPASRPSSSSRMGRGHPRVPGSPPRVRARRYRTQGGRSPGRPPSLRAG